MKTPDLPCSTEGIATLSEMKAAAADAAQLLKTLGNQDRLLLMCQLANGEFTVSELEALTGILQPTLSQQLGVLRQVGLVSTRKEGKYVYYQVLGEAPLAVMKVLYQHYCQPKAEQ